MVFAQAANRKPLGRHLWVKQHWANEIKEQGIDAIIAKIKEQLAPENIDELYVSFDIDALDEQYASATGTPEAEGMTPDDAMKVLVELAKDYPITGADMMEIAPFTNSCGTGEEGTERTLKYGAELSALLLQQMAK